jgi:hypothetical protein
MAIPGSPIPEIALTQLINALQTQADATLTAAIIAASGRAHSVQETMNLLHDVHWSRFPAPGNGAYMDWLKNKQPQLIKAHT